MSQVPNDRLCQYTVPLRLMVPVLNRLYQESHNWPDLDSEPGNDKPLRWETKDGRHLNDEIPF